MEERVKKRNLSIRLWEKKKDFTRSGGPGPPEEGGALIS